MSKRIENERPVSVVVGCGGQDGFYLTQHLERRGQRVIGISRDRISDTISGVKPAIKLTDRTAIKTLLSSVRPTSIYYLAAHHHSSEDAGLRASSTLGNSLSVHVAGLEIMLTAALSLQERPRVFYAGSSHLFGWPNESPQTEETPLRPISDYGLTKRMGVQLCDFFSSHRDLFCAVGILYNHESPRRTPNFVSRKISSGVAAFALGGSAKIELGDLEAVVDWGAAKDYVRAMEAVLLLDNPDRFVIASGVGRRIKDFVETACKAAGVVADEVVSENSAVVIRQPQFVPLIGDPSRLKNSTGWKPRIDFEQMVTEMVHSDLDIMRSETRHKK